MIKLELKNGDILEVEGGQPAYEAVKKISMGLFRDACAVNIDGVLSDLRTVLEKDVKFEVLTFADKDGKHAYWHTASHVLAQAVKRLYPEAVLAIGPAIDNGFYYDIDVETPFTDEDLAKIEDEMRLIIKEKLDIERFTLPSAEAIKNLEASGDKYKVEIVREHSASGEDISFYKQGDFTDLCAGPHLMSTGNLKIVKLLQTTGAYWRGDAQNAVLCRVYGIAFPKQKLLDEHLERLEEMKKRDHRKVGRELELFQFLDAGPGLPFFLPKGMALKNTILEYWREEHHHANYEEISTPILLNQGLWETSGHWYHYKENMYTTSIEDTAFAIKPMNCPGALLLYNSTLHSYREFPLRVAELGIVHRHEPSGTLNGLKRVRCFTQDDAHIFMLPSQIKDEIVEVAKLIDRLYTTFGFEYHVELSTRPENSMGSDEDWDNAISSLREALDVLGYDYIVNEGDGAFYGPKIDFHLKDSMGNSWQCGTIQLDFQQPQRFGSFYIGEDGEKHQPIMIHRAALGSIERFIAVLIEHYAGAFPTWLAPVQVRILPISEKVATYAKEIEKALDDAGIRVELDERSEKIGYKLREAQLQKIPYFILVGEKEAESGRISVRKRSSEETNDFSVEDFIKDIKKEIAEKINY